jgi:hypothetical protein
MLNNYFKLNIVSEDLSGKTVIVQSLKSAAILIPLQLAADSKISKKNKRIL